MKKKSNPAALERMAVVIQGVADRTVSAVNDLVAELKTTGMNDSGIRQRIIQELDGGTALAEMRRFATARCPGFVGDMTFRFARDTLASKQAAIDALNETRESRQEAMEREVETSDGEEKTRREAILEAYERQGIDITAFEGEELPEPPADADLTEKYMWVAIVDKNTCEVCEGNHGEVRTLEEWAEIGEPRSGACMGDQNCRCILVPESTMTDGDKQEIKDNGPINVEKRLAVEEPPANKEPSTQETSVGEDIDVYDVPESIIEKENEIVGSDKERAVVFDQDGNVILDKIGGKGRVELSDAEVLLLEGNIFTHNHEGGSTFGSADFDVAVGGKVRQMRAITATHIHVLEPAGSEATRADAKYSYSKNLRAARLSVAQMVVAGEIDEADVETAVLTETCKLVAVALGMNYSVKKRTK
jgi:hypothetical protein